MAVSKVYLIQLGRMIERLRDNYPLNKTEERKLNEVLNDADRVEVERRYWDIRRGREFMTLPTDHSGHYYAEHCEELTVRIRDAIHLAKHDTSISLKRIAKYENEVRLIRARGYTTPAILAEAECELLKWQALLNSYIDSVRSAWERTPEEVRKRFFDFKGTFSLGNLPTQHGNPERWCFPDLPDSRRSATIEVLELKIERLARQT